MNKQVIEIETRMREMQATDPRRYAREKDELAKELHIAQVQAMKDIIALYEVQNPDKWPAKKERLESKLAFMEAGGSPAEYDLLPVAKQIPEKPVAPAPEPQAPAIVPASPPTVPSPVFVCDKCKFEAKSKAGLGKHASSHKETV